jgi:hypothetical protein
MVKWTLPRTCTLAGALMLFGSIGSADADVIKMGEYKTLSRDPANDAQLNRVLYAIGLGIQRTMVWAGGESDKPLLCMGDIRLPLNGDQWRVVVEGVDRSSNLHDDTPVSVAMVAGFMIAFACPPGG